MPALELLELRISSAQQIARHQWSSAGNSRSVIVRLRKPAQRSTSRPKKSIAGFSRSSYPTAVGDDDDRFLKGKLLANEGASAHRMNRSPQLERDTPASTIADLSMRLILGIMNDIAAPAQRFRDVRWEAECHQPSPSSHPSKG
jgi:hypothetical protein